MPAHEVGKSLSFLEAQFPHLLNGLIVTFRFQSSVVGMCLPVPSILQIIVIFTWLY